MKICNDFRNGVDEGVAAAFYTQQSAQLRSGDDNRRGVAEPANYGHAYKIYEKSQMKYSHERDYYAGQEAHEHLEKEFYLSLKYHKNIRMGHANLCPNLCRRKIQRNTYLNSLSDNITKWNTLKIILILPNYCNDIIQRHRIRALRKNIEEERRIWNVARLKREWIKKFYLRRDPLRVASRVSAPIKPLSQWDRQWHPCCCRRPDKRSNPWNCCTGHTEVFKSSPDESQLFQLS